MAAEKGHLNILQYAHERGCPWDEMTVIEAIRNGHFDCVQYALDNRCDFDEDETDEDIFLEFLQNESVLGNQ